MSARVLTSMLLAFAMLGCKPEDEPEQPAQPLAVEDAAETFAREICASIYACSCPNLATEYENQDECVERLRDGFQLEIDELLGAGASWNAECAGELVHSWSKWGCLGPQQAWLEAPFDRRVCPVIKGPLAAESECVPSSIGDLCSEGSTCVAGVCVTTQVPVPLGSTCEYDWQPLPCEAGSYCGVDVSSGTGERICKPLPAAGDPCTIEEGIVCGLSSQSLVCNYETMRCEAAPGVGEPCADGYYCGAGNYCDGGLEFTCQQRFELGEGCGADAVCPVDASCVGNLCVADPPAVCELASFNL